MTVSSTSFAGHYIVIGLDGTGGQATGPGTSFTIPVIPGRRYFAHPGGTRVIGVTVAGECPDSVPVTGGTLSVTCGGRMAGTIPPTGGTVTGSTAGTSEFAAGCQNDSSQAPEHVYSWTPAHSGMATFSTCGTGTSFDTVLYVSNANDGSGQFQCNDQTYACDVASGEDQGSRLSFFVNAGTTYYIYVDGNHGGQQGAYSLTVVPPAFNGTIPPGGGTLSGTLSGGSTASGSCGGQNYPEHVYEWTPATSGQARLSTCGSDTQFDSALYLVRADNGAEVGCQDDLPGGGCQIAGGADVGSNLTAQVTAGVKYLVYVDATWEVGSGAYSLTVAPPAAQDGTFWINTSQYTGRLCIGNQCTQEGVGGLVPFTVAPGVHTISAPFTNGPEGGTLGTVTILSDGTLLAPPQGASLRGYFDINVPAATIVAKTVPVRFEFEESPMSFVFSGVSGASPTAPEPWLLVGRTYSIASAWAWDPVLETTALSPTGYGLTVKADGSDVELDQDGAARYFD